jgi:DNA-binding beta-propeller fold protein YncE
LPDSPRLQYLTTINNSRFLGKRSKFATFILGPEVTTFINKPYVTKIFNNKLFICDGGSAVIDILDLNQKKCSVLSPSGGGNLTTPLSLDVDSLFNIYVGDVGRHEVLVFDSSKRFINALKDTGDFKPTDVFISGSELWVTNPNAHVLNVYDKNTLKLKERFGKYEQGDDGYLYAPFNLFVSNDKVYVTDFGDFKIKIFDKSGKFIKSVGSYGTSVGQFVRPKGICVDRDENLFVVDAGFENTQIFNKDGQLLMFFGGPYKSSGDMWLPQKITIDYDNIKYFEKFVATEYKLKYIVIVSNQFGPDKINVYGAIEHK